MKQKNDPLSREQCERLACDHHIDIEVVANLELLRDFLGNQVEAGDMLPSDALELYCSRLNVGDIQLIAVAEEFTTFTEFDAATETLDMYYEGEEISELLDYLDDLDPSCQIVSE